MPNNNQSPEERLDLMLTLLQDIIPDLTAFEFKRMLEPLQPKYKQPENNMSPEQTIVDKTEKLYEDPNFIRQRFRMLEALQGALISAGGRYWTTDELADTPLDRVLTMIIPNSINLSISHLPKKTPCPESVPDTTERYV